MLLVGEGKARGRPSGRWRAWRGKVVLQGRVVPDAATIAALQGQRVLAFAGIGRPEKLATTLTEAGIQVAGLRAFPDHHPYAPADIAGLIREAEAGGLKMVTTSKDMARLRGPDFAAFTARITPLPVRMTLTEPAGLNGLLARTLTPHA